MASYHLSKRAARNVPHRDVWGPREKSMGNPWSSENPEGIAAAFLNEVFQSRDTVTDADLFVTPGLSSAIDALVWSICDEGDGILIPQPFYNGFSVDVLNRSGGRIIEVPYGQVHGTLDLEDIFDPEINKKALEVAYVNAMQQGINVRALMISHPHNPLGRCYPPETLKEFAAFCGRHELHFISDEIYALSVFQNPTLSELPGFVSTLALDLSDVLAPSLHHVMYGASKDFCANGLRLGLVCTKNIGIIGAMSSISIFSWSSHILQDVWAAMLENKQWLESVMNKKTQLMKHNYEIVTSFFREHGIEYFEMNAGLFVWVNLQFLLSNDKDHSILRSTSKDAEIHKQHELKIADTCAKHGVMIAPGNVYMPEEYGWFRITFTVGTQALREGLDRLLVAIKELKM
ncbi:hypothetical protein KCU71_g2259, partial [Aureobasidium melanogenum]